MLQVRGNLRAPREEVLEQAVEGVKRVFDGRFEVSDPVLPGRLQPQRVVWVVMAASVARPGARDTFDDQQALGCSRASSKAYGCIPTMSLKPLSATHLLPPPAQSHPSAMASPQTCLVRAKLPHHCPHLESTSRLGVPKAFTH